MDDEIFGDQIDDDFYNFVSFVRLIVATDIDNRKKDASSATTATATTAVTTRKYDEE